MAITELNKLSAEQKIQMMESLWDSLCSAETEAIQSPEWHGNILAERELALRNGSDDFEDWEKAKTSLRNLS